LSGEYTLSRYPGRKPRVYNDETARRCVEYARGSSSELDRLLKILSEGISKGDELLRGFVSSEYPSSTIVLFGSRARGDYMPYSDYDAAVVFRKVPDERANA